MAKVSDEEADRIEAEARHEELASLLKLIAEKDENRHLEAVLAKTLVVLERIEGRKQEGCKPVDTKSIVEEIAKLVARPARVMPKSFRVERDSEGLITKVVVEG